MTLGNRTLRPARFSVRGPGRRRCRIFRNETNPEAVTPAQQDKSPSRSRRVRAVEAEFCERLDSEFDWDGSRAVANFFGHTKSSVVGGTGSFALPNDFEVQVGLEVRPPWRLFARTVDNYESGLRHRMSAHLLAGVVHHAADRSVVSV